MVADARRNVKLLVETESKGEDALRRIGQDLRDIAQAAGAGGADLNRLADELDRAAVASKAAREAERQARSERDAGRAALEAQRDALARLRAESTAASRATTDYQAAERAAKLAIIDAQAALRGKRDALAAASAAAVSAVAAERNLADAARSTAQAFKASGVETVAAHSTVGASVDKLQSQLAALRNVASLALGGSVATSMLKSVSDTADAVTNLQARLKLVTGDGQAFADAWAGVQSVAQRTNTALESTGTLFARIAQAGKNMGVSQREALALTETINEAIQLSGSSAQASEAAVTQLIQGLQSGVVRGEEFNSIMEQAPRLAQALAAGLGVTTGELRKLAEAGTLTTQTVVGTLRGQAQVIREEHSSLPPTVGRALQQLSNAWAVYVNDVSTATGATTTAAGAISALAANLDTVATVLIGAGKAAAAYAALGLAKAFLASAAAAGQAATATQAATAATVAATAATTANTTAQAANAAATVAGAEAAAAGAGKWAALASTLKTFALVAVVTNFKELGTWIGETTARAVGYGKALDELEAKTAAEAKATRDAADAKAALAQKAAFAADEALGLADAGRELVGEFEGLRTKGESTTDALDKVGKALKLGDVSGIQQAGAALDALAQRGKIAGDQIAATLAKALAGEDLLRFETQARAAFDSSEQGARRLKAALDAIATESLRRAGTSVDELKTGFSAAAVSAVNDLDALKAALDSVGAKGEAAGRALTTSIGKALDAAGTSAAVDAVIARIVALGKEGKLTGDALAAALEKARTKADELRPGINSVTEAFRTLGLKAPEELARVAAASKRAWETISNDATVSLEQKRTAFEAYARTIDASTDKAGAKLLEVQGRALGLAVSFDDAGRAIVDSMSAAAESVEQVGKRVTRLGEQLNQTARGLSSVYEAETKARSDRVGSNRGGSIYDAQGFAVGSNGQRVTAGGQLQPPDNSGDWEFVQRTDYGAYQLAESSSHVVAMDGYIYGYWARKGGAGRGVVAIGTNKAPTLGGAGGAVSGAGAINPTPTATVTPPAYTVNINLGGRQTSVNTASAADQAALANLLRDLETAASRGG